MVSIDSLLFEGKYKKCREWILDAREHSVTWEKIKFGNKLSEIDFDKFLSRKKEDDFWDISKEDWFLLVEQMKHIEGLGTPGFIGEPKRKILSAPESKGSCWIKYKEKLEKSHFSFESIHNIETATVKVISQLCQETEQNIPVRGIVVGNVQSGKTANMAGVIAMAADYGYNFFIVLSGTIDNLRKQTRDRLVNDLNAGDSSLNFVTLDNLSNKTPTPHRLQDLFLDASDKCRYLTVCLKNVTRLRDLLDWLNKDKNKKSQLKILIIDDESDQAGINTANISKDLQSTISKNIKSLVFGRTSKHTDSTPYKCMNYIGYTATPYANFLNEANDNSLYPVNFIMTLNSPAEYIGPQQIFGIPDINIGLPIVNEITEDEIQAIQSQEYCDDFDLSEELQNAIKWFICTVAVFRFRNLSRPVSMLIHTSQRVDNHNLMASTISNYLDDFFNDKNYLKKLENVWYEQTTKLSYDRFLEELSEYSNPEKINDYPDFENLIPYIKVIANIGVTNIKLNEEEGSLNYNKGLHLCVDNCYKHNIDENTVMRLVYPDKSNKEVLSYCPAFIVVGGATLSRGLTLEGLTTSYFLRTTSMADTLMQMGRWFGYRKSYELLPRLWLSNRAIGQFKRLTKLDFDLREELRNMESLNLSPKEYGPKLDSFPDFKILKITSKNKMQNAYEIQCDFSNKNGQTTKFFNDDDIINSNFSHTVDFINELGFVNRNKLDILQNPLNKNEFVWLDQDYTKVFNYLKKLKYPQQYATFNDIDKVEEWFSIEYDNGYLKDWTIVLSSNSKKSSNILTLNNIEISLPSRRKLSNSDDEFIYLKTITAPNDRLLDIDFSGLKDFDKENILYSHNDSSREKRVKYGLIDKPLLVIYIIDKDSGKNEKSNKGEDRIPLNTCNHLVGYDIFIPYGKSTNDRMDVNKVTVKLDFDTRGDIYEDED